MRLTNHSYFIGLVALICFALFISTNEATAQSHTKILVNPTKISPNQLSKILKVEREIQLKLAPSRKLIGFVFTIKIAGDRIFLLDNQSKSIFVYDFTGNCLQTLDRRGRGAGEYSTISDFDVDEKAMEIVVLDGNLHKLLYYDYSNKFLRSSELAQFGTGFILKDKNTVVLNSKNNAKGNEINNGYSLGFADIKSGKILKSFFPIPEFKNGINISARTPLVLWQQKLYYQPPTSSTLYEIGANDVFLRYTVDFGKYFPDDNMWREARKEKNVMVALEIMQRKDYVTFPDIVENNEFVTVKFDFRGRKQVAVYNKSNKKTEVMDIQEKTLDPLLYVYNNLFVCVEYNDIENPKLLFCSLDITN